MTGNAVLGGGGCGVCVGKLYSFWFIYCNFIVMPLISCRLDVSHKRKDVIKD